MYPLNKELKNPLRAMKKVKKHGIKIRDKI
jgi:hypothetical protein